MTGNFIIDAGLGAAVIVAIQIFIRVAKRLLGLKSDLESEKTLRVSAEKRAVEAEERLRLAELDLASKGITRPEQVTARVRVKAL